MEQESHAFFNSPVIRKNTPIKRLGLSRKRKSCGSGSSPCSKIPACDEKLLNNPSNLEKLELDEQLSKDQRDSENENTDSNINYYKEIELLREKITKEEDKLKTLQSNKNKIEQLENLIALWKNGCKNAFFHFSQLLKSKESENIDLKSVLNNLGVWNTMVENFQDDPEICFLENSQ